MNPLSRRKLILSGLAGTAAVTTGVTAAARNGFIPPDYAGLYGCGHTLTYAAHRLLTRNANAREFTRSQISAKPHPNGLAPKGEEFARLQAAGFRDWRLTVDGLCSRPGSIPIAGLKTYPSRSQITQLICEEGWSYIAEWTGVPLSQILNTAGVLPQARYVLYYSMDGWMSALDMDDAWHPQTLVSYSMNSGEIPIGHGGPLRLRVPKQLGYKSLKFLNRVTLTDTLRDVPDLVGDYSWYAGI